MMIWGGRICPYLSEIGQGRHWAQHVNTLSQVCVIEVPTEMPSESMRHAKLVGGENNGAMRAIWNMMCYVRYRIEESKIRRRIGIYKASDRHMSLYLSGCLMCRLHQYM